MSAFTITFEKLAQDLITALGLSGAADKDAIESAAGILELLGSTYRFHGEGKARACTAGVEAARLLLGASLKDTFDDQVITAIKTVVPDAVVHISEILMAEVKAKVASMGAVVRTSERLEIETSVFDAAAESLVLTVVSESFVDVSEDQRQAHIKGTLEHNLGPAVYAAFGYVFTLTQQEWETRALGLPPKGERT